MSVTALHLPFKRELEPIVRVDEYIGVARSVDEVRDGRVRYYRVVYIEPLYVEYVTPSIDAGAAIDVEARLLELGEDELGQVRILVEPDGFEVELHLPRSVPRYSTQSYTGRITYWLSSNYPHLTEVYYLGSSVPWLRVRNATAAAGSATIRFVGFKYYLVPESPPSGVKPTIVYVQVQPERPRR